MCATIENLKHAKFGYVFSNEHKLYIYRISCKQKFKIKEFDDKITALGYNEISKKLIVGFETGSVHIFELNIDEHNVDIDLIHKWDEHDEQAYGANYGNLNTEHALSNDYDIDRYGNEAIFADRLNDRLKDDRIEDERINVTNDRMNSSMREIDLDRNERRITSRRGSVTQDQITQNLPPQFSVCSIDAFETHTKYNFENLEGEIEENDQVNLISQPKRVIIGYSVKLPENKKDDKNQPRYFSTLKIYSLTTFEVLAQSEPDKVSHGFVCATLLDYESYIYSYVYDGDKSNPFLRIYLVPSLQNDKNVSPDRTGQNPTNSLMTPPPPSHFRQNSDFSDHRKSSSILKLSPIKKPLRDMLKEIKPLHRNVKLSYYQDSLGIEWLALYVHDQCVIYDLSKITSNLFQNSVEIPENIMDYSYSLKESNVIGFVDWCTTARSLLLVSLKKDVKVEYEEVSELDYMNSAILYNFYPNNDENSGKQGRSYSRRKLVRFIQSDGGIDPENSPKNGNFVNYEYGNSYRNYGQENDISRHNTHRNHENTPVSGDLENAGPFCWTNGKTNEVACLVYNKQALTSDLSVGFPWRNFPKPYANYSLYTIKTCHDPPLGVMCKEQIVRVQRENDLRNPNMVMWNLKSLKLVRNRFSSKNSEKSSVESDKEAFLFYLKHFESSENGNLPRNKNNSCDIFSKFTKNLKNGSYNHDIDQISGKFPKGLEISKNGQKIKVYNDGWRIDHINNLLWPGTNPMNQKHVYAQENDRLKKSGFQEGLFQNFQQPRGSSFCPFIVKILEKRQFYRACMICILLGDLKSCETILAEYQEIYNDENLDDEFEPSDVEIYLSIHNTSKWDSFRRKIDGKIKRSRGKSSTAWYLEVIVKFLDDPSVDLFPNYCFFEDDGQNQENSDFDQENDLKSQIIGNSVCNNVKFCGPSDLSNIEFYADVLAYKLRYRPKSEVVEFVQNIKTKSIEEGNLSGLIFTGLTEVEGFKLLQNFVDTTVNFKYAADLAIYGGAEFMAIGAVKGWMREFTDCLNMQKKYAERIKYEKLEWQIQNKKRADKVDSGVKFKTDSKNNHKNHKNPKNSKNLLYKNKSNHRDNTGFSQKCDKCNKIVGTVQERSSYGSPNQVEQNFTRMQRGGTSSKNPRYCPNCTNALPRCSICELNIGYADIPSHLHDGENTGEVNNNFWNANCKNKNAVIWCKKCKHVGHVSCALKWFNEFSNCAVSTCQCFCNQLDKHVS